MTFRIIVEGPDGSGKTQLISWLALRLGFPIYPTQGPPKNPSEIVHRVISSLQLYGYIFDRFPLISQMVYGPILRDEYIFDNLWLNRFDDRDIIIYCRPPIGTILQNNLKVKPHKNQEHIQKVNENRLKIINSYDDIMGKVSIHHRYFYLYNYLERTPEDLCAELTCVLGKAI